MAIRGRGSKKISPSTAHWSVLGPGRAVFLQPLEGKKRFCFPNPEHKQRCACILKKSSKSIQKKNENEQIQSKMHATSRVRGIWHPKTSLVVPRRKLSMPTRRKASVKGVRDFCSSDPGKIWSCETAATATWAACCPSYQIGSSSSGHIGSGLKFMIKRSFTA